MVKMSRSPASMKYATARSKRLARESAKPVQASSSFVSSSVSPSATAKASAVGFVGR